MRVGGGRVRKGVGSQRGRVRGMGGVGKGAREGEDVIRVGSVWVGKSPCVWRPRTCIYTFKNIHTH